MMEMKPILVCIPYYDVMLSSLSQLWSSLWCRFIDVISLENQIPSLRRGRRQRNVSNGKIMFIFIAPLILTV